MIIISLIYHPEVSFFRFHSNYFGNGIGFKLKYELENTTRWSCEWSCGGNYFNQSGILTSPLYPNPYPAADCTYVILQPSGTYINISFLFFDIDCKESNIGTNFLEIRDGESESSPVIGKLCGNGNDLPTFMATNHNVMRIRWKWLLGIKCCKLVACRVPTGCDIP